MDFKENQLQNDVGIVDEAMIYSWSVKEADNLATAVQSRFLLFQDLFDYLAKFLFANIHSLTGEFGNQIWPNLQDILATQVHSFKYESKKLCIGPRNRKDFERERNVVFLERYFRSRFGFRKRSKSEWISIRR